MGMKTKLISSLVFVLTGFLCGCSNSVGTAIGQYHAARPQVGYQGHAPHQDRMAGPQQLYVGDAGQLLGDDLNQGAYQ